MDYCGIIESYYRAYRDRDRAALEGLLTSDFRFISSYGEHTGRDSILDKIWPAVGQAWATNIRVFGDGPEFVVLYHHDVVPESQQPKMRMAEYVRFVGDRIAEIEVFMGRQL
jgi:hypothetical protein